MPIDFYLLDTSVASAAWDEDHSAHAEVQKRLADLDRRHIYVSVISIAEVEYGLKTAPNIDKERQVKVRNAMGQYDLYYIDKHTAAAYSDLRAALFLKYSPKDKRAKRLSQIQERTSEDELGIQENDLWIASVALQHNFVLATRDKMARILEVGEKLKVKLRHELWLP